MLIFTHPGFEPRLYGTIVSVANHHTGWATLTMIVPNIKDRRSLMVMVMDLSPGATEDPQYKGVRYTLHLLRLNVLPLAW
ncbi:hypothetical protein TNCV_4384451 [Trichonephila clavipes]|nr:hypothetical protein TNCV_4384451 [Trichonephila clavipes]